eukprot:CAMPEP_0206049336 /NCGR_PEP_ID=MMETSP1466-20131121/26572_1 /ASSEMBLY_ACC=CAM_ASM_001126 /TAXON_ID=44452 /ORGANISM="Pavlova gyrans, Strain CCMP608" /LENGTH=299 /DNA_ID=CAMNT_0053424419 /DNA_START=17 /DNA_END=916 /DNA_ORIENTATION=+
MAAVSGGTRLAGALLVLGSAFTAAAPSQASVTEHRTYRPPVLVASNPRTYIIEHLFSQEECNALVRRAEAHGMEVATIMSGDGTQKPTAGSRASFTAVLGGVEGNDLQLRTWRERMAAAALLPVNHAEPLAIAHYRGGHGDRYELHFDSSLSVGRVATVLVFLSDVHHGGELMFPWARAENVSALGLNGITGPGRPISELQGVNKEPPILPMCLDPEDAALKISPRAGRAVVFFSHTPDLRRASYRAMHAGCPPARLGEDKWLAQLFIKWHPIGQPNLVQRAMAVLNEEWRMPLLDDID